MAEDKKKRFMFEVKIGVLENGNYVIVEPDGTESKPFNPKKEGESFLVSYNFRFLPCNPRSRSCLIYEPGHAAAYVLKWTTARNLGPVPCTNYRDECY